MGAVDTTNLPPSAGSTKAKAYRVDRVEKVLRERDVLKLSAVGGYSDKEISELLTAEYAKEGRRPIGTSAVRNARRRALARYTPDKELVDRVRGEQLLRLDQLLGAVMPKGLEGNVRAIETALKIEAARAELVGTKAPKKVEHGGAILHAHELVDSEEVDRLGEAFRSSARAFDVDASADEVDGGELLELPSGGE